MNHQDTLIGKNADELGAALREMRYKRRELKAQQKEDLPRRQSLSADDRRRVLEKTGGRCHICGGPIEGKWDADHVLAHSGGGSHSVDNYLPAHSLCNNYRWDYLPEEFQILMKLGVWCRKQIEEQTATGRAIGDGFLKHETRRLGRR
jgi:5-methylcytosine-specific restriction endonuclease McrA